MKLYTITAYLLFALLGAACSNEDNNSLPTVTPEASGTFTDERDGTEYHWVRMGGLDWMVENFRYPLTIEDEWSGTIIDESKCAYYVDYEDHLSGNTFEDKWSAKYGYLYTHQGAVDATPDGWRLPTDEDWKNLEKTLGMSQEDADANEWRGSITGQLMRQSSEGTLLNMLMAGYYTQHTIMMTSGYRFMGSYGFYWTATADKSKEGTYYFYRKLYYNSSQVYRQSMEPDANKLSVRYVRNAQ